MASINAVGRAQKRNGFINEANISQNILSKVIDATGKPISDGTRAVNLIFKTWDEHSEQTVPKLNSLAIARIIGDIKDMMSAEESAKVATIRDPNDVLPRVTMITNSTVRNPQIFPNPFRYRVFFGSTTDIYGSRYSGSNSSIRRIKNIRIVSAHIPNLYKLSGGTYNFPAVYLRVDEIPATYTSVTYPGGGNIIAELRYRITDNTVNNDFLYIEDISMFYNRPFRDIDTINVLQQMTVNVLAFDGTPLDQALTLSPDVYAITAGAATNPIQITTAVPHNLVSGERVAIVDYKSTPSGNIVDYTINRSVGHPVLTVLGPNIFTIDVNAPVVGSGGYVFKSNRQFHIGFEFESYTD